MRDPDAPADSIVFDFNPSKMPRFKLFMPKCERCGKEGHAIFYSVCDACINELIEADRTSRALADSKGTEGEER